MSLLHYEYIAARGEGRQWRVANELDNVITDFGTEAEALEYVTKNNQECFIKNPEWKYGFEVSFSWRG